MAMARLWRVGRRRARAEMREPRPKPAVWRRRREARRVAKVDCATTPAVRRRTSATTFATMRATMTEEAVGARFWTKARRLSGAFSFRRTPRKVGKTRAVARGP